VKKKDWGNLCIVDAQRKTLEGATTTAGAALMVIAAEEPTQEELEKGLRDPLGFYSQYGFAPFPGNARRLFKLTRVIEAELKEAKLI
jgi:hypothetical protein